MAEQFLEDEDSVDLYEATLIDDAAFSVLAKHKGDLWLENLGFFRDQ